MLPPFSWSFIPLYWQNGESKIMKVCKGFLWHGHRFFHLFFKAFSQSFYVFSFSFCCVCVWDTTSHGGGAIYSSQSVEESLKGCVPSTQGFVWKTLKKKRASWESSWNGPLRQMHLTLEDTLSVFENVSHPCCWVWWGSCQCLHHHHLHMLHKKLLRRKWHQS